MIKIDVYHETEGAVWGPVYRYLSEENALTEVTKLVQIYDDDREDLGRMVVHDGRVTPRRNLRDDPKFVELPDFLASLRRSVPAVWGVRVGGSYLTLVAQRVRVGLPPFEV